MAQALKNYEHYADLHFTDNPKTNPEGALLRAVSADYPLWCVSGQHGDRYFQTLAEVKNFCQGYTFTEVC